MGLSFTFLHIHFLKSHDARSLKLKLSKTPPLNTLGAAAAEMLVS